MAPVITIPHGAVQIAWAPVVGNPDGQGSLLRASSRELSDLENMGTISPILASSPRDSQEQWAASNAAPGDQVQVPGPVLVRDRTEGHLFLWHVFCCYMGGTAKPD